MQDSDSLVHDHEQLDRFGDFCRKQLQLSKEGRLAAQLVLFKVERRYKPNEEPVVRTILRQLLTCKHDLSTSIVGTDARDQFTHEGRQVSRRDMSIRIQLNPRNQMQALNQLHARLVTETLQSQQGWKNESLPADLGAELLSVLEDKSIPADRQLTAIVFGLREPEMLREFALLWTREERARIQLIIDAPGDNAYYVVFTQKEIPSQTHKHIKAFQLAHPACSIEWECTGTVPVPGTFDRGMPVGTIATEFFLPAAVPAASSSSPSDDASFISLYPDPPPPTLSPEQLLSFSINKRNKPSSETKEENKNKKSRH